MAPHHYFHDTRPLGHIARALRIDSASWHDWYGLHVRIELEGENLPPRYPLSEVQSVLLNNLTHINGNAYICRDGEVMVISRNMPTDDLRRLGEECRHLIQGQCELQTLFTVCALDKEWRRFAFNCEEKAQLYRNMDEWLPHQEGYVMDISDKHDINELFDFYHAARTQKESRLTRKVMVVEDDPLTRRMVSKILKDKVELVTAEDVDEALVHYVLHAPDIVFLDIGLPGTDG